MEHIDVKRPSPIQVASEIGRLRKVLLHRPGKELESLTPQYLDAMLFEDIPYLLKMQEEHDFFAETLRGQGCRILYIEELLKEVILDPEVKQTLIGQAIESAHIPDRSLQEVIYEHLDAMSNDMLTQTLIAGFHKDDLSRSREVRNLSYYIRDEYPFYISPLPNLYFTRDPGSVVGNVLSINTMRSEARKRESQILSVVVEHHPEFLADGGGKPVETYQGYAEGSCIEGGDILVLNAETVMVGCSARTEAWAIEELARLVLACDPQGPGFKQMLVVQIPFTRAYMHLDTVFTMVDHDKFTIYPGVESRLKVFRLTLERTGDRNGSIKTPQGVSCCLSVHEEDNLRRALKQALGVISVDLIRTGGGDSITAAREQWNDSTNTLAVAPGTVVTYRRNMVSNETLERHGITVLPIPGSELVRGRGGPRCMSMPLFRDGV